MNHHQIVVAFQHGVNIRCFPTSTRKQFETIERKYQSCCEQRAAIVVFWYVDGSLHKKFGG